MTRRAHAFAAGAVAVALVALSGCGLVADSNAARETLPPLPPPGGVLVNKPALPEPSIVASTEPVATAAPVNDDADPTSVAGRFLAAVRSGDESGAQTISSEGRDPSNFGWARQTFDDYTAARGPEAWGAPACAPSADSLTARCTWLAGDELTALVLVNENGTWRVSHPQFDVATPETPTLSRDACIAGTEGVNFRGGPGRQWPRFTQLTPGTCGVVVYEREESTGDGEWRLIEVNGQQGWVVERVLQGL